MTHNIKLYHCQTCGHVRCAERTEPAPRCCGHVMQLAGETTVEVDEPSRLVDEPFEVPRAEQSPEEEPAASGK